MKISLFCTIVIFAFFAAYIPVLEAGEKFQYKSPQFLYEEKCSKCHDLDRVFAEPKTEVEWQECVARMAQKNPMWITNEEGAQIIGEIAGKRRESIAPVPRQKKYGDVQLLFIDRCTKCHTVSRILKENKTRDEWEETVLRMRDNAPEQFAGDDVDVLTEYLTERGKMMRDDVASQIMVEKCLVCHEATRIFLERKSRKDWEKCVADMRALTRQKFNKDWFTSDEFRLIVELLVKTQGG